MRRLIALVLGLGGCGPSGEPLDLRYTLRDEPGQQCPASACDAIELGCDAVVSIRIVDPAEPSTVFLSECMLVEAPEDLCGIARATLPENAQIPTQRVEVQVAVYPRTAVEVDGELRCPSNLAFGADDLPLLASPTPAFAGRAFASDDATTVDIELGCTDPTLFTSDRCQASDQVSATALVDDFDTLLVVAPALAPTLQVSLGAPRVRDNPVTMTPEWFLEAADLTPLPLTNAAPTPTWSADLPLTATEVCAMVVEDGPATTATLACTRRQADDASLDLRGARLAKPSLTQILSALGETSTPNQGLVIGRVVDPFGRALSGIGVSASREGTAFPIEYLSTDRTALTGGTQTTASGIFVARTAPFDSVWQTSGGPPLTTKPVGGLVAGKVTLMILVIGE